MKINRLLLLIYLFFSFTQQPLITAVGKNEEAKRGVKREFGQISEIEETPTIASLLFQAVEQEDIDQLRFLVHRLNIPQAVNAIEDENGNSLLLEAVEKENLPIVNFLLERGANPNLANEEGITPLMSAVSYNNSQMVQRLLEIPNINLNAQDARGVTPVHLAAAAQFQEPFALLIAPAVIARGLDVNLPDNKGNTPLIRLVNANNLPMLEALLGQPRVQIDARNENGATALTIACHKGFTDAARLLLSNGANPNLADNGKYPLDFALEKGHDIVRLLIENGANPNNYNPGSDSSDAPLLEAIRNSPNDIIQLLIQNGADVNIRGENGMTPLQVAAARGNLDIIDLLLARGAEINARNNAGDTPLMQVAKKSTSTQELIERLLAAGADAGIKNNLDLTARDIAQLFGNKKFIEILDKHSVNQELK